MTAHSPLPPKLSAPAQRALTQAGIRCLEDLTRFNETEIRRLHGIGPNALAKLQAALRENNLHYIDQPNQKS